MVIERTIEYEAGLLDILFQDSDGNQLYSDNVSDSSFDVEESKQRLVKGLMCMIQKDLLVDNSGQVKDPEILRDVFGYEISEKCPISLAYVCFNGAHEFKQGGISETVVRDYQMPFFDFDKIGRPKNKIQITEKIHYSGTKEEVQEPNVQISMDDFGRNKIRYYEEFDNGRRNFVSWKINMPKDKWSALNCPDYLYLHSALDFLKIE